MKRNAKLIQAQKVRDFVGQQTVSTPAKMVKEYTDPGVTVSISPRQFTNTSEPKVGDKVEIIYGYGWDGLATIQKITGKASYPLVHVLTDAGEQGAFSRRDFKTL